MPAHESTPDHRNSAESALRNLGVRAADAREIAHAACDAMPGASEHDVVKAALRQLCPTRGVMRIPKPNLEREVPAPTSTTTARTSS